MAQLFSQPAAHADVKVVLNIEISEELKALLTAQGWTPPGELPILNSEHRRILDEQAAKHDDALSALERKHAEGWRRQQERHRTSVDTLVADQRRAFDRLRHQHQEELDRQAKEFHVALREARKKSGADIRAEVAEEIARDLEKPREWRISPEEPAPWAAVARAHGNRTISFPPDEFKVFWTP